jgi:antitoxin (DNA-binding transcriptional repressor) of toxin-antitoxin stability system
MKRMTASDARKNWFRLLDEVAAGAVVSIERGGRTIVLRRAAVREERGELPDYSSLVRAPDVEDADRWSWDWREPGRDLDPVDGEGS